MAVFFVDGGGGWDSIPARRLLRERLGGGQRWREAERGFRRGVQPSLDGDRLSFFFGKTESGSTSSDSIVSGLIDSFLVYSELLRILGTGEKRTCQSKASRRCGGARGGGGSKCHTLDVFSAVARERGGESGWQVGIGRGGVLGEYRTDHWSRLCKYEVRDSAVVVPMYSFLGHLDKEDLWTVYSAIDSTDW